MIVLKKKMKMNTEVSVSIFTDSYNYISTSK